MTMSSNEKPQLIWLVDGRHAISPAVKDKVIRLAQLQEASLTVLFDNRLRARERHYWFMFDKSEQAELQWRKEQQQKQATLSESLKQDGIDFSIDVLERANYLEAINRHLTGKKDPLLVIQDQSVEERHPLFQDLANISCNILLLRQQPWSKSMKLLGAVDPSHENAKHQDIDFLISKKTRNLAKLFKSDWFIAHACHIPASFIQYKTKISTLHRQGLDDFIERIGATPRHGVLLNGLPERALADWISKQQTDILFIGNVTRNMLLSHLVGSTTMALLSKPPCDMYLVKNVS